MPTTATPRVRKKLPRLSATNNGVAPAPTVAELFASANILFSDFAAGAWYNARTVAEPSHSGLF
jgi:hypothetical protein